MKITSEAEYKQTLARVMELMDAKFDTPEGKELATLAWDLEVWEVVHCYIDPPTRWQAFRFRWEQRYWPKWRRYMIPALVLAVVVLVMIIVRD